MDPVLMRQATAAETSKSAPALFAQLERSLQADGEALAKRVKGLIVFDIDGEKWSLDLREGTSGKLSKGPPTGDDSADLTLTVSDDNFAKLVMGKLNAQQAFLLRKLKISGSMGMAMKLQPVLEAAQPKSKL